MGIFLSPNLTLNFELFPHNAPTRMTRHHGPISSGRPPPLFQDAVSWGFLIGGWEGLSTSLPPTPLKIRLNSLGLPNNTLPTKLPSKVQLTFTLRSLLQMAGKNHTW